jgi:hypothetical protein
MFEDLPSSIPVGIASVSGQNQYEITVEVIGGFVGYSKDEALMRHNESLNCLKVCDDNVADFIRSYRACSVGILNETLKIEKCGPESSPLCDCIPQANALNFPKTGSGDDFISFQRAAAPILQFDPNSVSGTPSRIYFSRTKEFWVIPFNDKNTRNQILSNSEPIPCNARELQSLSSDEAWEAAKEQYQNAIKDRDKGINVWTDSTFSKIDNKPRLLLRFTLKEAERQVDWEILERKVMSFYVQPVNDRPRIVVPSETVLVAEDSLTPVPDLLLFDDGKDSDEVRVTFVLDRGFATSFKGLVASDNMKLEKVFSSSVQIIKLDEFVREFRLVSPDNIGPGNFDFVRVDIIETEAAGFGEIMITSAVFYIAYTKQPIADIPSILFSVPDSQISLSENARFYFDGLGLVHITGTDSSGVRNGINSSAVALKISCRGPFGVLALQQSIGRRILDSHPEPLCATPITPSAELSSLFPEFNRTNVKFCRDIFLYGLVEDIENQAQAVVYSAFRYNFSLIETSGVVLTVIGPSSPHPVELSTLIVNENKLFFSVSVSFVSNMQLGATLSRVFKESWTVLQRFSPPISWAFEDSPALFHSQLSQFVSEPAEQLYTITISSRLNQVYISSPFSNAVNFQVGSGLLPENTIVFQASSALVRAALLNIMYISNKNFNTEFDKAPKEICTRDCFAFHPNSPAARDSLCSSTCKDTIRQFLESRVRNNDIILDDIIVDINDQGSGGLGLTRFSTKLHLPLFVAAINDGPCLSFSGAVFANCFDSAGKEIISNPAFNFEMDEGTSSSISLGDFAIIDYDMFEKAKLECMNASLVAEAQRDALLGDIGSKLFLSSCPVIKVAIFAARGLININFRSGMTIYEGSTDQFTPSIKYFGSLEQVVQSLRNVRYKLSPSMRTFSGLEKITVTVDDGGFSGADPVGQFENVAAASSIEVTINILPINNPPEIKLPSSSGGSFQIEENAVVLMQNMVPSGLAFSIYDIDSDDCSGILAVKMSVNIGSLDLSFMEGQPILRRIQNFKLAEPLTPIATIATTPSYCDTISFSASNQDIKEILSKMEYRPPPFVNSEMLPPNSQALLTVTVSDRKASDGSFNCGRQLASTSDIVKASSGIFIKAVNHAPYASFSENALLNGHFETPPLCGGRQFYVDLYDRYSWRSQDAYVSNGAIDSSIPNTPAYYPGTTVGSDTGIVHFDSSQGTQWVTILREGFIRQPFRALLAPDGLYSIQFYISRPSPPSIASDCAVTVYHRNGSIVLRTFISSSDIQSQSNWALIKTPSFSGSSCGYTLVDTFDSRFSCEVEVKSSLSAVGDSWGFSVDAMTLNFEGFQSVEGARVQLRGLKAIDPDVNSFSLNTWAAASAPLKLKVSLGVANGLIFFNLLPGIMNTSSLVAMFPRGCNSQNPTACFEDVCSFRFRMSNTSVPNCFNEGVILLTDCTFEQNKAFRSQCQSAESVNGIKYPKDSKLSWSSIDSTSPQPCPDGWLLLEDESFLKQVGTRKACANMKLTLLKGNFLYGAASLELAGSPIIVNDYLSTLSYVPRLNYNSQSNRGLEFLSVDVNDFGHSGRAKEPVLNTLRTFSLKVIAINNPPRIDSLIPKLELKEDYGPVPMSFLSFVDVDSEEPPGVAIFLKIQCDHCIFSLMGDARMFSNNQVDVRIGANKSFVHFEGRLPAVQDMFRAQLVLFESLPDFFGEDAILCELNDRGGSGVGNFDMMHNAPPLSSLSRTNLVATYSLLVRIIPVNDISKLILSDESSGLRYTVSQSGEVAMLPLLRKQGTPEPFGYIAVEDVDSELGISISLSCQNGLWKSMSSSIRHVTEDDGRTVSIISGNRTEINIWLKDLHYIADETFLGSEDVVVKLTDNATDPATSSPPTTLKIIIPLSVLPIIRCLFNDCKTCNEQKDSKSACGWCPSACNGQGRCIEAELNQDGPKFGTCSALSNGQKWMMCEPPEKDLITPVILGYLISTVIAIGAVAFFYSYRTNYGSLRSSIRSKLRIFRIFARDFNLLPHKDFQFVKLFVVACCGALAIIIPSMLGVVPTRGFNEILTGASSLSIKVC